MARIKAGIVPPNPDDWPDGSDPALLDPARLDPALLDPDRDRSTVVLDVVDSIPPGRVMSYGDIARFVGMRSARQVGQILARRGHEVPWHRVVMADGSLAPHSRREHLARLRKERAPLRGDRVDMSKGRWCPGRGQNEPSVDRA